MVGKKRMTRWLVGTVILAVAECAAVVALDVALTNSAQAQFFDDDRYGGRRYRSGGGFFGELFGPSNRRTFEGEPTYQAPVDNSRAPSPRKPDPKAEPVTPTTSIVVMGDGMADWLAYGLEDAFSDAPEIGIVRKNKIHSGLLRYEAKGDLDWWHVARDLLAQEKPSYVVMMLGVGDRQNIREKDLAKEADKKEADKKKQPDKIAVDKNAPNKDAAQNKGVADKEAEEPDQPSIIAPEPQPGKRTNGIIEFRTDKWAEVYARRIDETVAALKSKGVPVFWVGLPAIRGTRSTADVVYLNDLYRARAERAGAIYIDVWDGFVDEAGKYSNFGPDFEGQVRRLRSNDGVYFSKYGARKLAHYVERELRRYMSNRSLQISLPSGPVVPAPADVKSTVWPLAGPVMPLTVAPINSDELISGSGAGVVHGDAIASRVLVKGEPVAAPAGRADDFAWPRGNAANAAPPVAAVPAGTASASAAVPANPSAYTEPAVAADKKPAEAKSGSAGKTTQSAAPKPKREPQQNAPRPPQPIRPSAGPLGWLR
ncbi:MAG: DUF459 domain-containing protein [Rhizobiales bacterium]|nr:DUF459 domain-containing protein [Hyphomicrobiales bacterium]